MRHFLGILFPETIETQFNVKENVSIRNILREKELIKQLVPEAIMWI